METQSVDWTAIHHGLIAPFTPDEVEWKVAGKGGANARASLVAFVSARAVAERLDSVVGCGGWAFDYEVLAMENGEIKTCKGTIFIGGISKSDVGFSSNWELSKGAVSDALKRAGVLWGIGRSLYTLPSVTVTLDTHGKVPEATLATLRERLAARVAA
jgi:hypothetical protein